MSKYINKTDGKFNHGKWIREKSQEINEISTKAGLDDVIKGKTSAIEGIEMSKELAQGLQDWIARSPYGRKYGKQINKGRIHSVIGPADVMGIERYLSPAGKKEWKELSAKHKPKREAVTERLNEKLSTSWIKDPQVKGKVDAVIKTLKNLYGREETVDGETMEFILKAVGLKGQIKKQV